MHFRHKGNPWSRYMSAGFIAFALLVWVIKAWPALALLAISFPAIR